MRYSAGTNAHNIDYSLATSTTINRELSEYILSYSQDILRYKKTDAGRTEVIELPNNLHTTSFAQGNSPF